MKKSLLIIGIIIIVILLTIGFFVYQNYGNSYLKTENTNRQSTNENVTNDWKTYRNGAYDFEIGYPGSFSDMQFIDYKNPDDLAKYHIIPGSVVDLFFAGDIFTPKTVDNGVCGQYHIHITPNSDSDINVLFSRLRKELETPSNYEGYPFSSKITDIEDVIIQGRKGKKFYAEPGFPHYNGGFVIINNGKLYQVSYLDMSDERNGNCPNLDYRDIFDRMVSSFKFTE